MEFGPVPLAEALGAIAVHSVRLPRGGVVKKGTRLGEAEMARLRDAGVATVVVARPAPGDRGEDEAAHAIAQAVAGEGVRIEPPATGRSNLYASHAGVLVVDRAAIDGLNRIDEAITLATLPAYKAVVAGEMIGTVKIIPFAVPGALVDAALAIGAGAMRVAAFRPLRVGVVSTLLPGLKDSVVAKTLDVLAARLAPAGARVAHHRTVPHDAAALADALAATAGDVDLTVVFGASAITDRRDIIPAAIARAGGVVTHFGMPVDPGNLLLVGELAGRPVIGAPGCARSPAENGFDWVLQRLLAGLAVTRDDIVSLGVGGLLMEIVQRGHPREGGA